MATISENVAIISSVVANAISPSRCESIIELAKEFPSQEATITTDRKVDPDYRTTEVTWLPWPVDDMKTERAEKKKYR